jgi:hypothetical protein
MSIINGSFSMEESCISITKLYPFKFTSMMPVTFLIPKECDDMGLQDISQVPFGEIQGSEFFQVV